MTPILTGAEKYQQSLWERLTCSYERFEETEEIQISMDSISYLWKCLYRVAYLQDYIPMATEMFVSGQRHQKTKLKRHSEAKCRLNHFSLHRAGENSVAPYALYIWSSIHQQPEKWRLYAQSTQSHHLWSLVIALLRTDLLPKEGHKSSEVKEESHSDKIRADSA